MRRVTSAVAMYITVTWDMWASWPEAVRDAFQTFGREHPQGMGRPTVIEIPAYRLPEILEIARAAGVGGPEGTR